MMDMGGIAPASACIQDDRHIADRPHANSNLGHFRQGDCRFRAAGHPALRTAAKVDRLEADFDREPGHERVQGNRCNNQLIIV